MILIPGMNHGSSRVTQAGDEGMSIRVLGDVANLVRYAMGI